MRRAGKCNCRGGGEAKQFQTHRHYHPNIIRPSSSSSTSSTSPFLMATVFVLMMIVIFAKKNLQRSQRGSGGTYLKWKQNLIHENNFANGVGDEMMMMTRLSLVGMWDIASPYMITKGQLRLSVLKFQIFCSNQNSQ